METKNIIFELRTNRGLSQDELAERICVTRQAVSRWENGETVPNTETLKLLSKLFDVSINTLLGSPRKLICQCCGMPLEDSVISKEPDGDFNEDYCKWCYAEGQFAYKSKEALLDYLVANMPNPDNLQEEDRRVQFDSYLSRLKRWKYRASAQPLFEITRFFHIRALKILRMADGIRRIGFLYARKIQARITSPRGRGLIG